MFACIHASALDDATPALLLACAQDFSPLVEQTAPDIALLDVSGLERIYGPPQEIAAAILRRARALGVEANAALASNPDTAICAARGFSGTSIVPHGDEAKFLESLPLELLDPGEEMLDTFERWGIRTFRGLAMLPAIGLAGRLGPEGVRLQKLARGEWERPLQPVEEPLRFAEEMELEYPLELLEPLSFLLARLLGDLCRRLGSRGLATNQVRLRLELEDKSWHERTLHLPVPMRDARTFVKLLELDLSAHPPAAPITYVHVAAEPVKPRPAQDGLFLPAAPEAEKLELTLARVAALVGQENVGSAEMLDTHRPDAFRMRKFGSKEPGGRRQEAGGPEALLVFRVYRPALAASVASEGGKIITAAGPWRTSGDWWTPGPWDRDEWDIGLADGSLYRIYCDRSTGRWFVEGNYD